MPKKGGFLQKFYNAAKEIAGFSSMPTVDDVRAVYGPAQTLGAPEDVRVAMDSQLYDSGVYSLIQHTVELGQMPMAEFVGYGMLQSMSQNGLLRACIETVADDMTRNWIKLEKDLDDPDADEDGEVSPEEKERIKEEEREGATLVDEMMRTMNKYHLREVFHDAQELVGYEGGAMIYIDTGAVGEELKTPLNLTNYTGELKMGDLKGFIVIDPVNVFPGLYNSTDPLRADYFVPKTWWVLGQEVHESRLVRLVDNEVPILLRPSYNFMGIPQAQILWDYVLHFQQCRFAATELVTKHSMTVFKTQIGDILFSGEGTRALDTRIKYFKQNRDNLNIVAIDKENEDLVNVESSVAGVDSICKQSLEYLAAINRTPAVKLLGLSPTGFNATGESDIRNYYDHIKSQQEKIFRDGLQKCLDVLQLNLNGKIDKSLKFEFVQLSEEDKNTLVTYQKTKADVIGGLLDHNIISGEEARKALSDDPDSGFSGLDPDEVPEDEGGGEEGGMGGMPPMGGGMPPEGAEQPEEGNPEQGQPEAPANGEMPKEAPPSSDSAALAQDEEDERWITTKNNHRVLLDEEGKVEAGMGGKFNGEKISEVGKGSAPKPPKSSKPKTFEDFVNKHKGESMAELVKSKQEIDQKLSDNKKNFFLLGKIEQAEYDSRNVALTYEAMAINQRIDANVAKMTPDEKTKHLDKLEEEYDSIKIEKDLCTFDFINKKISMKEFKNQTAPLDSRMDSLKNEIKKLKEAGVTSSSDLKEEQMKTQVINGLREQVQKTTDGWKQQYPDDKAQAVTPQDPTSLTKDEMKSSLPTEWGKAHGDEFVKNIYNYSLEHDDKNEYMKAKYDPVVDYGIRNSSLKWDGGTLYRGKSVNASELAGYKVGGIITAKGLTSWTQKEKTGEGFTDNRKKPGEKPVVFIDRTQGQRNAMSVENASFYGKNEREVMYAIDTKFKIKSMEERGGVTYIDVETA